MSNNEATEILLNDKDDHGFDVGERLKALRKSKGLSQRKLARRSGVSNGTISLIEQNKISPSVASLKHLLSGMHVSISEFFSVRWMPKQNFFFRANELSEISSDTGISFRQVGDDLSHKRMQIMRERYADGADTTKAKKAASCCADASKSRFQARCKFSPPEMPITSKAACRTVSGMLANKNARSSAFAHRRPSESVRSPGTTGSDALLCFFARHAGPSHQSCP